MVEREQKKQSGDTLCPFLLDDVILLLTGKMRRFTLSCEAYQGIVIFLKNDIEKFTCLYGLLNVTYWMSMSNRWNRFGTVGRFITRVCLCSNGSRIPSSSVSKKIIQA